MQWNKGYCFEFDRKSMETETTTWSEFLRGGKTIAEPILASEDRNKSKRAGLWVTPGIQVEKLTNWVRLFEIEKLYQSLSVLPEQISQSLWWQTH